MAGATKNQNNLKLNFVLNEFALKKWTLEQVSNNTPQTFYFKHENKQFDDFELSSHLAITDLIEYEELIHFEVELVEAKNILLNCEQVISFMLSTNDFEITVRTGPVPS